MADRNHRKNGSQRLAGKFGFRGSGVVEGRFEQEISTPLEDTENDFSLIQRYKFESDGYFVCRAFFCRGISATGVQIRFRHDLRIARAQYWLGSHEWARRCSRRRR